MVLVTMEDTAEIHDPNSDTTENYEMLVREVNNELQFVQSEQNSLKQKILTVVDENKRLANECGGIMSSKENRLSSNQNDIIENLKLQIKTLQLEKEHATNLWKNEMKSREILEQELNVYQTGTQEYVPKKDFIKVKHIYEGKIKALETKLGETQKKLHEYMKAENTATHGKNQEIDKSLENQAGALKIIKNLEEEVLTMQNRLQEFEKTRIKLQKNITEKDGVIKDITNKNLEYRNKVTEAVQIVDAALNEKDAALLREKYAKEQIDKINQVLSDIIQETEEKVKKEVAYVKVEYNQKCELLHNQLKQAQEEIKEKTLEIEKYCARCSLLESDIEKYHKGTFSLNDSNTSKLLILEKNLESTFQKLLISEKQNIQLASDIETIKNDMEQMSGHYERTLKTKEIERLSLHNKIKQLETNLDESHLNMEHIKKQLDAIYEEKAAAEKRHKYQLEENERLMTQTHSENVADITNKYNEKIKELQRQLNSKQKLNKKWILETKSIINNLEKIIINMKSELQELKKEKRRLKQRLQVGETKFEQYKMYLQLISKDVNKVSYVNSSNADEPG